MPGCPYTWVNHPSCWVYRAGKHDQQMAYSYVKKSEIQPYWTMATQYTLGDQTFASKNGPSLVRIRLDRRPGRARVGSARRRCRGAATHPKSGSIYLQYGAAEPARVSAAFGNEVGSRSVLHVYDRSPSSSTAAKVTWRWYMQPQDAQGAGRGLVLAQRFRFHQSSALRFRLQQRRHARTGRCSPISPNGQTSQKFPG